MPESIFESRVFQTGETNETLRAEYNPEGSLLRDIQYRLLAMLDQIVSACEELGIEYYLDGGTLLGAVRHRGFIPWDDDLDIVIDVKDIKRLENYLISNLDGKYFLQNRKTERGYYYGWNKLRDNYSSSFYQGKYLDVANQQLTISHTGVSVDIFQYSDHVIPCINKILHGFHKRVVMSLLLGRFKLITKFFSWLVFKVFKPLANLIGLIFSDKGTIAHDYCSCNTVHRFRKDKVYPLSTIVFEGRTYKAPNDVDYYLKTLYNDYMSLPPKEERHHHDLVYTLYPYNDENNPLKREY